MSKKTASGDYLLPGAFRRKILNGLLHFTSLSPAYVSQLYLNRHRHYQAPHGKMTGESQGDPASKWMVMAMPADLAGKTVLDIGCAEGLFSLECARRGAERVVGIDSNFRALLCGRFVSRREELGVEFRIGVFPDSCGQDQFDYVFCLSVLHHLVSTKDMWRLLSVQAFESDLGEMRRYLRILRSLVKVGGRCIVEMPYEYADQDSKRTVDLCRFNEELIRAGFRDSQILGSWDHAARNQPKKDRVIYSAVA